MILMVDPWGSPFVLGRRTLYHAFRVLKRAGPVTSDPFVSLDAGNVFGHSGTNV